MESAYRAVPIAQRVLRFAAAGVLLAAACASAQNFPSKTVRIVASEAGGSGDFVARLIAQG